jgi:Tol biopolymer transport system component/DNA-binding winged helix-turn-helix (wHTH) protein
MADYLPRAKNPVRFGVFELDPTGVLRKHGTRIKLQDQPLAVLLILLEKAGQLVTREELRRRLWPSDTFVEFDKGIYNAMKRLRETLGDEAETPRYIETIPKHGYRFLAEVFEVTADASSAPLEQPQPNIGLASGNLEQASTVPQIEKVTEHRRAKPQWIALGATLLALLSGMGIWRSVRNHLGVPQPSIEVVPLRSSSDLELELKPAFSPDGNQVAFYVLGSENAGIYTTMVGGEKSLRLTSNPGDCCPRWSPDGRQVAFFRTSDEGVAAIYVIPAFGGTEHRLYSGPAGFSHRAVDWSPDGKVLAFTESHQDRTHAWIALLSLTDSSIRRLTSPSDLEFDYGPAFSPDGSTVAFIRGTLGGAPTDLDVVPSAGGAPRRLTYDNTWIYPPPTWTPDGRDIVFSSARGGMINLWRISSSGGNPWAVGSGIGAMSPSISPKGNQLVYHQAQNRRNIWRLDLRDEKHPQSPPRQVIAEKGWKGRPYFSPDGKRIAFESWHSGYLEIRACDSEGSNCEQLTSLRGTAGGPRWSPDGRYIAFEFRPKDRSEIYLLKLDGSMPQLLPTLPGADNLGPNWSRDGKWIYFYSDQGGGPFQVWKVQLNGGSPVQVTRNGGTFAAESADGRFLYYSKYSVPGIWKMPLQGGEESRVLDQPYREPTIPSGAGWLAWWDWALTRDGIYFLNFATKPYATVEFFEFATQKIFPIWTLRKFPGFGLSISADGKSILYVQNEIDQSNIMLVKNFR